MKYLIKINDRKFHGIVFAYYQKMYFPVFRNQSFWLRQFASLWKTNYTGL